MAKNLQLGIIGHPLGHTLSPILHQFLMENLNIKGEYIAYDTPPDKLKEMILYLKTLGVRGVNVTVPHKVNAITSVNEVDAVAERVGAVNTLVFEHTGKKPGVYGYNTDVPGFLKGIPPHRLVAFEQARVLILGGGGAARAVMMALLQYNAAGITLCARNESQVVSVMNAAKLAKRQLTWLRSWPNLYQLDTNDTKVLAKALKIVENAAY